ncbi:trefoil factor 3 [Sceloporus undulatus]|uniref:trefoil factor 3 n=1 Tax=Sceloporus undulatus TaxID=8520 RepID=UPI001C4C1635|nr:trefoil factor 3 [Sceloporus undulatus]
MEKKLFLVFTICLIVGLSSALLPSGQCNVPAKSRQNCGYPGIDEIECSARQCCFDSNTFDAPWCFNPVPVDGTIMYKQALCSLFFKTLCLHAQLRHDVTSQLLDLQTKSLYIRSNTWDGRRQEVLCYSSIHICRHQNQATYVKHLSSSHACQCLMDVKERKNCDFASKGITAEECTANGCCFDSTVPDVPWCFKPSGERVSLRYAKKMIEPEARMQCGYEGISRKRCKRIGCCFDPTVSGPSMCFHPPVNNVSKHCLMDMSAREDCGYPGITAEKCQEKGCCFNSYVVSTRWCFRSLSDTGRAKMCGMAPKKRVQCGYPGISADECLGKGCCYEHYQYLPKVPWCFEPSEKQDNFLVCVPTLYVGEAYAASSICWKPVPEESSAHQEEEINHTSPDTPLIWNSFDKSDNSRSQLDMNCNLLWLLMIALVLGLGSLADARKQRPKYPPGRGRSCNVPPARRQECGWEGISRRECELKGCCFSNKIRHAKWCFYHG